MALRSTPMLPARDGGASILFLTSALVTIAIMVWTHIWSLADGQHGLSAIFCSLFVDDYPGALIAVLILFCAFLGSRVLPLSRYVYWAGCHPVLIASSSACVLALGTLVVYRNHPLSMDEYAAYFQSRVFAAGQVHGRFPPPLLDWLIPHGFQNYFLNVSRVTGSVTESYWPGFALLMTPFTWAGISWLCNPVLSGLTLLVVHRLALALFEDRYAAGFALLLTLASPVIFADGISYYSMPSHLLANSVFAWLLLHPTLLRAAVAGVVGSLALALHNPVPHLLFAAPWLVFLLTRQRGVRLFAALIAGYLPLCVLLGLGWFMYSGHLLNESFASRTASMLDAERLLRMTQIFSLPNSTVMLARLIGLAKLWVWAVPGLMILAVVGAMRWWRTMACRLLAASALLTFVGYFLVPVDQGHGWGYRYFHSAWMTLPLLATAALFPPIQMARASVSARPFEDSGTKSFVAACILLTLTFGSGFRAWQIQSFVASNLKQAPQFVSSGSQVVILDTRLSFYGADLVQNDPWLRGNEIKMYSRGAAADSAMMAKYYPNFREVYEDRYGTVWSGASKVNATGSDGVVNEIIRPAPQ